MTDVQRGRHCAARRPVTPLTLAARAASQKAGMVGRGSALVVASSSLIVGSVFAPTGAIAESPADNKAVNAEAGNPVTIAPAVVVSDSVVWSDDATTLKVKPPKADEEPATPASSAATATVSRTAQPSRSAQRTSPTVQQDEENSSRLGLGDDEKESDKDSKKKSTKSDKKSSAKKSASDAVDLSDPEERGAAVVAIAKRYLGVPYVAGGSSPSGFDCSGFTSYVYAKLGIELPRTSSGQRHMGKVVSASKALPGDIVWSPGHVAIYLGNGQIIDAPRPGKSVQIRAMYQSNPVYIRVGG